MIHILIAARGGSKRLPNKNTTTTLDRPMIYWAIQAALETGHKVYVSSEDKKIQYLAKKYCDVIVRPKVLAEDDIWTKDVVAHFIGKQNIDDEDIIVLVQANSPSVTTETINKAISIVESGQWEVSTVGEDFVNNGAVTAFRAKVNKHEGKANYNAVIPTDFVDVHYQEDVPKAEEQLVKNIYSRITNGNCVVLNDYFDVSRLKAKVENILKNLPEDTVTSPPTERLDKELLQYNNAVVNYRGDYGYDSGMIDVIKADLLLPEVKFLHESKLVRGLLDKFGNDYALGRYHLYINDSVSDTRGFHRDSPPGHQFKVFVYLNDVLDEATGPYTFVNGALDDKSITQENTRVCLGKSGTVVISDQGYMHRGLPQEDGKRRLVLVLNIVKVSG